jgi:hypothetical protein
MIRVATALLAAVALVGCGYNCQETCNHVYADSECGIATGQLDENEAIRLCTQSCEDALARTGDIGEYNPYSPYIGGEQPQLENEKQAALWMECVWDSAPEPGPQPGCDNLAPEAGFCAPI